MKVALIQFNAGTDKKKNLNKALDFVKQAISKKARWILLPEVFVFRGDLRNQEALCDVREQIPGPTSALFAKEAKQHKVYLLLGSILEKATPTKVYNTSVAINPLGKTQKYRKIHLFDARLGDKIIREAQFMAKGTQGKIISVGGFKAGLSICYDLRFPEQYRDYTNRGANVLTVPSCFTKTTGQAHWESLLRARAIENLSYVLAPAQVGKDFRGVESFGNSMIVSPWGEIIAQGSSSKEESVYGEISLEEVKKARARLPGVIKHN